ncbi:MAG: helix-turn-helix domain-containing protein [Micromonosporaceae bacterium]
MRTDVDDDAVRIGQRVKWWRLERKLSQQVLADRAGFSKGYISKIESGDARVDRRTTVETIAHSLGVTYGDLTGQPYRPDTPDMQRAHAALAATRVAFHSSSLEYGSGVKPRPLEAIAPEIETAADAWQRCDYAAAGQDLARVVSELHEHVANGDNRQRSLSLLVHGLDVAAWTARVLGHTDLAGWMAEREHEAARMTEDPTLVGFAVCTRSLMLAAAEGRRLAKVLAESTINDLGRRASGDTLELLGMLHLSAMHAVLPGDPSNYFSEAEALARRTGDGLYLRLWFGPTNLALWKMKAAVEAGEGGRVEEIARGVNLDALPATARRVMFYRDLGIGLGQQRGRETDAVRALMTAERLVPGKLRLDPLVRDTVGHMLSRARASAGGPEMTRLARHVGVF